MNENREAVLETRTDETQALRCIAILTPSMVRTSTLEANVKEFVGPGVGCVVGSLVGCPLGEPLGLPLGTTLG